MSKKILIIIVAILLLSVIGIFVLFRSGPGQMDPKNSGINPENLPKVVTDEDLKFHTELERIYGFIGKDVSEKDLSGVSIDCLSNISFDQNTKWPAENKLPQGFNPDIWMNTGRDPGLNIQKIHERGINGKGITVAIIDKPILPTHNEFDDRMTYVKVGTPQTNPHFHGLACASILAGKTCGVASGAKIYYFATPDVGDNFKYYIDAINSIRRINKSLPSNEGIKIVSISDGIGEYDRNWSKWQETLKKAETEGLVVVYSNLLRGVTWGGCIPSSDGNNPRNYKLSNYLKGSTFVSTFILVPGDFRTTASNNGDEQYIYWGEGGFSWAIPYVVGLAALAWQVNPDLSFDKIMERLIETKTTTAEGRFIIDPEAFIRSVGSRR